MNSEITPKTLTFRNFMKRIIFFLKIVEKQIRNAPLILLPVYAIMIAHGFDSISWRKS